MMFYMRTTLIIPDALMDEARETLGFTSKTDTVVHALREVVRRGRRADLINLLGRMKLEFDPAEMRAKEKRRLDRR